MSFIDDLFTAASNAGRIGAGFAEDGVRAFNAFAKAREDARRWEDIDARLEKAAKKAMGLDMGEIDGAGHRPVADPKGLAFDPFDMVSAMGYRERPSAFTYKAMEMVGRGVPVIADVIRVRTTQVQTFCQRPEDRHSAGLRVRLKDWRNQSMTKAAEAEAALLESVLLSTGFTHPDRPVEDRVTLKAFAGEAVADSLIYDQMNVEVVPDRRGLPSYMRVLDPSTIRLLDPVQGVAEKDPYAVQVIDGAVVADFTRDELAFCIRNPRSGIKSYGYGLSELETLIREITGFLWAMDYNRKFFTQGSATKGVLNFKGTIPDKHLKAFRRQWYAMVAGVANAWKTPITNAEDLQWINMQMSNRDMEYSAWMDFLIKVACARFQIAPEEINFSYGNTGQSQAMGNTSTEEKLKASRDLGLRPLVQWFFEQMNEILISPLNPDFEVIPVGLDQEGFDAETDLLAKQQANYLTIDEARERVELDPIGEEKGGDLIMNPTYLQYIQAKEAAAQGGDGMDDLGFGSPGDDEFGDEEDDDDDQGPGDFDIEEAGPQGGQDIDSNEDEAVKSERPVRERVIYVAPLNQET